LRSGQGMGSVRDGRGIKMGYGQEATLRSAPVPPWAVAILVKGDGIFS